MVSTENNMFQKTECIYLLKITLVEHYNMCYLLEHGDFLFAIY